MTEGFTCNISRMENTQVRCVYCIPCLDHLVSICLPYCCGIMASIFLADYIAIVALHTTSWRYSLVVTIFSWINLTQRWLRNRGRERKEEIEREEQKTDAEIQIYGSPRYPKLHPDCDNSIPGNRFTSKQDQQIDSFS